MARRRENFTRRRAFAGCNPGESNGAARIAAAP